MRITLAFLLMIFTSSAVLGDDQLRKPQESVRPEVERLKAIAAYYRKIGKTAAADYYQEAAEHSVRPEVERLKAIAAYYRKIGKTAAADYYQAAAEHHAKTRR